MALTPAELIPGKNAIKIFENMRDVQASLVWAKWREDETIAKVRVLGNQANKFVVANSNSINS